MNAQELQIDRKLLDRIIGQFDFSGKDRNLNMMDVINRVYDSTYMYFKLAYHEEKNLREKYEQKVADKVGEISKLKEELTELKIKFGIEDAPREDSSETDSETASGPTQLDLFR